MTNKSASQYCSRNFWCTCDGIITLRAYYIYTLPLPKESPPCPAKPLSINCARYSVIQRIKILVNYNYNWFGSHWVRNVIRIISSSKKFTCKRLTIFLFTALMFLVFYFNPRKYKRGRTPPRPPPPPGFSEFFSKRMKHQHLMFSAAVRSSLARILSQVQWWSVSMVTRYDVNVVKLFLSESTCFQLFQVNLVAKTMHSAYSCVFLECQA